MQSLSKTLQQAALATATIIATPILAGSPAQAFPKAVNMYDENGFVFPANIAPLETGLSAHNFTAQPVKLTSFKTEDGSAPSTFPTFDLGVNDARYTALYGPEKGSVMPVGSFFLHSNGNNKGARMDFGVIAGGLTASVGFAAKIEDGKPLNIEHGGASYSFSTTDITTATVVSIGNAWPVGKNWSVFGKDVDEGLFAVGISTEQNAKRAQFTTIEGANYLTESPRAIPGNLAINIGLNVKF